MSSILLTILLLVPITTNSEQAKREYLTGRTLTENLRATEAIDHFKKAVQLDPAFATAHLALSNVAPTATEFQAERALAVKTMANVSEAERLNILAAEAGAAAKPLEAQAHLQKIVALFPDDARARLQLGLNYFGTQDFQKAIEHFSKAIQLDPKFPAPYNMRGYAHRAIKDFKKAEADFKSYIKVLPDDPNPYDSYAELLLATGRYNESIEAYKKALAVRNTFIASRLGIISNLTYLGKHREALDAIADYMKAARNQAETTGGFYQSAAVYVSLDQPKKAEAEIEKSLKSNEAIKDYAAASFDASQISRTHLEYGEVQDAKRWQQRSEELIIPAKQPPQVAQANELNQQYNRIRIQIAEHKYDEARAAIAKYRDAVTARGFAFGIRRASELDGILALAESRWSDAIAALQKASLQDPYNLYRLAVAYEGAKQPGEARSFYAQAVDLNQLLNLNYAFIRNKAKSRLTKLAGSGIRQSE